MRTSGNSLEGDGAAGGSSDAGQAFEPSDFDGLEEGCLVRDACGGGWPFERIAGSSSYRKLVECNRYPDYASCIALCQYVLLRILTPAPPPADNSLQIRRTCFRPVLLNGVRRPPAGVADYVADNL